MFDGFAFVTGGAQGLGEAIIMAYAEGGASGVSIVDINNSKAEQVAKAAREKATNSAFKAIVCKTDITNEGSVQLAIEYTLGEFGRIDYAVNCAGILENELKPTKDVDLETYDRIQGINNRGLFISLKAELNAMSRQVPKRRLGDRRPAERGSIVNMGSVGSYISLPQSVSYVSSKHAVMGLTKSAAADHATDGIRVNAVAPTFIESPMLLQKLDNSPAEIRDYMISSTPMKRLGLPEEVADVVLFLTGPYSSLVTGQTWAIDGGQTVV